MGIDVQTHLSGVLDRHGAGHGNVGLKFDEPRVNAVEEMRHDGIPGHHHRTDPFRGVFHSAYEGVDRAHRQFLHRPQTARVRRIIYPGENVLPVYHLLVVIGSPRHDLALLEVQKLGSDGRGPDIHCQTQHFSRRVPTFNAHQLETGRSPRQRDGNVPLCFPELFPQIFYPVQRKYHIRYTLLRQFPPDAFHIRDAVIERRSGK